MPAGDRTGPRGIGPRTGRAAGYCGGYDAPGWANPVPGRGFGLGRGWGGGWHHRHWTHAASVPGRGRFGHGPVRGAPPAWGYGPYAAAPGREEEAEFLRQQAEWLKQELDAIGERIEELGKDK